MSRSGFDGPTVPSRILLLVRWGQHVMVAVVFLLPVGVAGCGSSGGNGSTSNPFENQNTPGHAVRSPLPSATEPSVLPIRRNLCPQSDATPRGDEILGGRSDLIIFHYNSGTQARVRITRAGCIPVTNGTITRGALGAGHGDGEVHWPDESLL